jgi:hypothetical protein
VNNMYRTLTQDPCVQLKSKLLTIYAAMLLLLQVCRC